MSLDFVDLAKNFGPFVAFTAFFVWQGWIREKRLSDRITELEKNQHEAVAAQLKESTEVIIRNTLVFEGVIPILREMQNAKSKP